MAINTNHVTNDLSATSGKVTVDGFPVRNVSRDGPLEIFHSEVKTYTITDYSVFSTYAVSATGGTVTLSGNQITYTAPSASGPVTITVTRDGAASLFPLEIREQELTSYIATPAATPANFGDPFEGGFYAGMIWNQLTQSSTSRTLATGTQTFTVPSMTSAPIVYAGHPDETLSAAAWRTERKNRLLGIAFRPVIDLIFLPIERDHCRKAYEAEKRGAQLPKEYAIKEQV